MQVTQSTSSDTTQIAANPAGYIVKQPKKTLDASDFMKLLSVQISHQDPLKPMDDAASLAQMAQFSSLQQSSEMSTSITKLLAQQKSNTAASYLGRQITVQTGTSDKPTTVSGKVSAVDDSGTEPQLLINGTLYPLSSVIRVELPSETATTT